VTDAASSSDALGHLQAWFAAQCDGEWEHGQGVTIESLDNPGWIIRVAVEDTELELKPFEELRIDRTGDDWLHAWRDDEFWHAACGPLNLTEMVQTFLAWELV
jgi:hypothetical protein